MDFRKPDLTFLSGKVPIQAGTRFGISGCRGKRMPKIVFRGKTYYSLFEMPPNIRRAYEKEQKKAGADNPKKNPESTGNSPPPTSEPDSGAGMRGLMWGILVALILTGLAYLLSRLIS